MPLAGMATGTTEGAREKPMTSQELGRTGYAEGVERLLASYRAIPADGRVRLAKKTSNLFRARAKNPYPGLDVSGLSGVIEVDPQAGTADVAGMCTYEDLVAVTLRYGFAPYVVPQLKTITLGGAVTGLGIESTSFRNGLPHESVLEMDILTGSGEIVTASPDGENSDLYFGFPNSYGTLGYSTRLKIKLEQVKPFVELRHVRFTSLQDMQDSLIDIVEHRTYQDEQVDYLDGVIFTADECYLVLGRASETAHRSPSDYTGLDIYYRSIQHGDTAHPKRDVLTISDYLWRWDTDWFWCSRAFGAQNPKIRRWWPKHLLRSSFYWKLIGYDHRYNIGDKLAARRGEPPQERVVQDIEVPVENTSAFAQWFLDNIPIEPIWLCPLRLREPLLPGADPARPWPLYPLEPGRTYVNFGFWSAVATVPGEPEGYTNRRIEKRVSELDGHKSLYSESFYDEDEFDQLYGGETYRLLKKRYDPASRLLDLYAKAVKRQ